MEYALFLGLLFYVAGVGEACKCGHATLVRPSTHPQLSDSHAHIPLPRADNKTALSLKTNLKFVDSLISAIGDVKGQALLDGIERADIAFVFMIVSLDYTKVLCSLQCLSSHYASNYTLALSISLPAICTAACSIDVSRPCSTLPVVHCHILFVHACRWSVLS